MWGVCVVWRPLHSKPLPIHPIQGSNETTLFLRDSHSQQHPTPFLPVVPRPNTLPLTPARPPTQILGDGELAVSLKFAAAAFSESAKAKIEAAGGSVEVLAQKEKWTRVAHEARVAAAASA